MFLEHDPNDKKLKILCAAAKVFAQKGFHQAKMEEIAREADVGKGTVYEYFAGKQELFLEMFRTGSEFYKATLQQKLHPEMSLAEKLHTIVYLHLKFMECHKDVARLILQEHMQINDKMHTCMKEQALEKIELLSNIFQEGMKEGTVRDIDSHLLARMFIGAVRFAAAPMIFEDLTLDIEQVAGEVVRVFLNGIKQ